MSLLQLPPELQPVLQQLGVQWPEGDEAKTFEYGQKWLEMGQKVGAAGEEGQATGKQLAEQNEGASAQAFQESFGDEKGPIKNGDLLSGGMQLGGGVLFLGAGAILALKVFALVQVVQFMIKEAQAIAAAPSTFGQSLQMIPIFKQLHGTAIGQAIEQVVQQLEGNGTGGGAGNPMTGLMGEMVGDLAQLTNRLDGGTTEAAGAEGAPAPGADTGAAPAGGAGTGATGTGTEAPAGGASPAAPTGGSDDARVTQIANEYANAGIPYAWGGGHGAEPGQTQGVSDGGGAADANGDYNKVGLDCSGLAREFTYKMYGIDIGAGNAASQYDGGRPVSAEEARPGDLYFPDYAGRPPGHVQVYIGNGQVLEAQQSGTNIMISPIQPGEFRRHAP